MGQRSQIFVRVNGDLRIAQYFQWNYAERMLSRARYGIEYMANYVQNGYEWAFSPGNCGCLNKFIHIFETNFDMKDVQISHDILAEYREYADKHSSADWFFRWQGNNDGQLLVDIDTENAEIKYAFVCPWKPDEPPMDAEQYMCWDCGLSWKQKLDSEALSYTEQNISKIAELAELMTADEVKEYTSKDYVEVPF